MNFLSPNKKNGIPTHEADKRDTQTSPRTRTHPHTSHTRDKNKKKHLDPVLRRPTTTKARTSKEYVSQPPLLKDPARMPPARVPVLQVTKTEIPGRRGPPRHRDKGEGRSLSRCRLQRPFPPLRSCRGPSHVSVVVCDSRRGERRRGSS